MGTKGAKSAEEAPTAIQPDPAEASPNWVRRKLHGDKGVKLSQLAKREDHRRCVGDEAPEAAKRRRGSPELQGRSGC